MPMFPNTMNQSSAMNMSTPLTKLPMKHDVTETSILEDPIIQNVLDEFKSTDEQILAQNAASMHENINQSINEKREQPEQQIHQEQNMNNQAPITQNSFDLRYNNSGKKIIDFDIVKRVVIITFIVLIFLNTNILSMVLMKLPPQISSIFQDKEIYINVVFTFLMLYGLMYYNVI